MGPGPARGTATFGSDESGNERIAPSRTFVLAETALHQSILRPKASADDEFHRRCEKLSSTFGLSKRETEAFTEQGIYMLMTVLKGELAIKQSKALIRTFKQMKDYIVENQDLISKKEFLQLSLQTTNNTLKIQNIRKDLISLSDNVKGFMDTLNDVVHKSELSDSLDRKSVV